MEARDRRPLELVLEAGRSRYNALFAQARRTFPQLEGQVFLEHLQQEVGPIAEGAAQDRPEALQGIFEALYELSLVLVGKDLLGPRSRHPELAQGWSRLLRALPERLQSAPSVLPAAVANALFHLCTTPGARPGQWVREMQQVALLCTDVRLLLEAGKVLAWRAGLAHYREGALEACRGLPTAIGLAVLGMEEGRPETALKRLREDPWWRPEAAGSERRLRVVHRIGQFRGLGGEFLRPARVSGNSGVLYAGDGEGCWQICADAYGVTLQRCGSELPGDQPGLFKLRPDGQVGLGRERQVLPELAEARGFASNATTLCVALPRSHQLAVVGRTGEVPWTT